MQREHIDSPREHRDTTVDDLEALRMLWIKDDACWDTTEVLGEHRKQLKPFSTEYKQRKIELLGHVIRAGEEDPMRKVTFQAGTIKDRGFAQRRVGRPKQQWLFEAKNLAWKKCRYMEDRQGCTRQDKRTKYKGKDLQEAYLHTWAEERHF